MTENTTAEKLAKQRKTIQRLLAKAENNPSVHEAKACQEHAERLMVRYGIDRAQLEAEDRQAGRESEKIIQDSYPLASGIYTISERNGLSGVLMALDGLEVILSGRTGKAQTLHVIGANDDVAQALRLVDSLREQSRRAMTEWWAEEGKSYPSGLYSETERRNQRKSFLRGFYRTVANRLKALRQEALADDTGSALVLRDRNKRVTQAMHEMNPGLRSRSLREGRSSVAGLAAGNEAGHRADLGGGRLDQAAARQLAR